MLLGGLWHGAAWTFVIWGAIHGLGLSLTRAWQRRYGQGQWGTWTRIPAVLLTFHLVCLAWIFFRSPDLPRAWEILHGLAQLSGGTANITPMLWGILAAGFATHLMPDVLFNRLQSAWTRWPAPLQGGILVVVVLAIRLAGTSKIVPFIYFQF